MPNEFGKLLRRFREDHGMSLQELASFIGISIPYLSEIERGRRSPLNEERIDLACKAIKLNQRERADLITAAAESRGYFELAATNVSPDKQAFGAALARSWNELEDSQIRRLTKALSESRGRR